MNVLYISKLYSASGNGVIGALQTEIAGLKKHCNVAIYNLGVDISIENFELIYNAKDYNSLDSLPVPFNKPDLVVFEEIYKWEYIRIHKELIKKSIPYIIIPHGSLVKREQKRKFLKKKLANILFFNHYVENASAIQFLNIQEEKNSIYNNKKTIVIPNSINTNTIIINNKVQNKRKEEKINFVYIGRYSIYTKGLDLLVNMCKKYKNYLEKNKIIFNLYGKIDNASQKDFNKLKKLVNNNSLSNIIVLHDAVYGSQKTNVLKKADFFIQLSRHEGQPMGIIEALSFGIPCIVTYNTSFGDYCMDNECGIAVEENIDSIYEGINKLIVFSDFTIIKYSKNARKNSINDFSIDNVGKKTIEEYERIIKE